MALNDQTYSNIYIYLIYLDTNITKIVVRNLFDVLYKYLIYNSYN